MLLQQGVEKRYRDSKNKAKSAGKVQFTPVTEHFEAIFNAVIAAQIVF